jgi:drug/metabolite transporter (DMT)-like permease
LINPQSSPSVITANIACFMAMLMWAVGFPSGEILLETWGAISLLSVRMLLAVGLLMVFWIVAEGMPTVLAAPWGRGLTGGIGFGFGAILLLVGQKMSDPVTPAIVAAMMPIASASIEVVLDKRKLHLQLLVGIVLAMLGGLLATGVRLSNGIFGLGVLFCLLAIFLFAWATRKTIRDFQTISSLGQTTVTLVGAMVITLFVHGSFLVLGFGETEIGNMDSKHIMLLLIFSLPAIAISQLLWIWAAGRLGILMASLHMNAVPFYVMLIVVMFLGDPWGWDQAIGGVLVATGVLLAQAPGPKKAVP